MPLISMLPVIIREYFGQREFPREPEPDLIMTDQDQVNAYEETGRKDGVMAASYLFHTARISQTIQGVNTVIDLACGPATQLCHVAKLNPEISFTGIDFSETMLESAHQYAKQLELNNISFFLGDISKLDHIRDNSFDAVISTMALHHLPTHDHLEKCFSEISRIKKQNGRLYITDFGRLKSLKSVLFFAYMNKKHQPHIFSLDYERSLRAAFLKKEFEQLASRFLPGYQTLATFLVPLIILIKSEDRKLNSQKLKLLKKQRQDLSKNYRRVLDDMRLFFKLSGLKNDPFS